MHRERERERFPLLCGCTCNQWMTHKLDAVGTREKLNLRIYTVDYILLTRASYSKGYGVIFMYT